MTRARNITALFALLTLIASACGGGVPESIASTETGSTAVETEQISEDPTEVSESTTTVAAPADDIIQVEDPLVEEGADDDLDQVDTTVPADTTTVPEEPEVATCEAPELKSHSVDVAIDDPDGGLNVRSGAGTNFDVVFTVARGKELITRGGCEIVGGTEWWEVTTSDGGDDGWASSRFLTDGPVFTPGLGDIIIDVDNVDLKAETLDELAEKLAVSYGLGDDIVITEVLVEALDAIGGNATYEFTGLKDDSVGGYRVEISWWVDRSADGNEVFGVIAKRIIRQPMCTRGVSADGLCI